MVDMTQFENAEEVQDYLRSEWYRKDGSALERKHNIHEVLHSLRSDSSRIDFDEVVTPLVDEWCMNNPELATKIGVMATQVSTVLEMLSRELVRVVRPITDALERWVHDNPDAFRRIIFALEMLGAETLVEVSRRRYEEKGVKVPFSQAVRLAFGLMIFRVPYRGNRGTDEGDLHTLYNYEIRAIEALHDDRLQDLIEGAQSSPLDVEALKEAWRYLRSNKEPIPSELREWIDNYFDESLPFPEPRVGRSPYTNQVRNQLIVETVQNLVDCGLTATRNQASPRKSACDAVSEALKAHGETLSYDGVVKVWHSRTIF